MVTTDDVNNAPTAAPSSGTTIRLSIGGTSSVFFTDPVCKMQVERDKAADKLTYKDKNYYFCHPMCAVAFSREPELYLPGNALQKNETPEIDETAERGQYAAEADQSAESGQHTAEADQSAKGGQLSADADQSDEDDAPAGFTCPMHPEIVTKTQMPCPLCGMALDPLEPQLSDGPDGEYIDMLRRFKLSLAFTVPIAFVGMQDMYGSPLASVGAQNLDYALFALTTPVVAWLGAPFFSRFASSIKAGSPNMFTLIGAGVGIAYGYSVAVTFIPALRQMLSMHTQHGATYFEPAAVITTLALLGQVLELRAREATGAALHGLMTLTPATAHFLKLDDQEIDLDCKKLKRRDRLRVKPGERVPADGTVISGESTVDESMLTGESLPVTKAPDSTVIGGTINQSGSFIMRVDQVGKQTVLAQIIKLVAQAQRSRAQVQNTVDKVATYFMPVVLATSVIAFLVWTVALHNFDMALVAAISVLIIACPCALGLATPMSITVAMGRAARLGILVKDAATLEQLSQVDTVVLDKTGTLTQGQLCVERVQPLGGQDQHSMMRLVAALEQSSEHPLAQAIVAYHKGSQGALPHVTSFASHSGAGVSGFVDGHSLIAGNLRFVQDGLTVGDSVHGEHGEHGENLETVYSDISMQGFTPVAVAIDGKPAGVLGLRDSLRDTARGAIQSLRSSGIDVHLLTGDDEQVARGIAASAGIDHIKANALPATKHQYIEDLIGKGKIVAMVGDGINDAPALARAHVGIAMSTGTNIAMQAAGIVILAADLNAVVRARQLSIAMSQNIKQNLVLAFGYNIVAVPIAAGLIYPFTGMMLSPMVASVAMALSSVSVISNALRLNSADIVGRQV